MSKLAGKVALVTGGNSGIGLSIAQRFVNEGAYVFITGRRQDALAEACRLLGKNVWAIQSDVTQYDDLKRLYQVIREEKSCLDT